MLSLLDQNIRRQTFFLMDNIDFRYNLLASTPIPRRGDDVCSLQFYFYVCVVNPGEQAGQMDGGVVIEPLPPANYPLYSSAARANTLTLHL